MADFRLLMVCTANHCRSPMAEQLMRFRAVQHFGADHGWRVGSAGTDIPGSWPLHEYAKAVLAERLPMVAQHHSVPLDRVEIARADLVLTAARRHRGVVVSTTPAAVGRTFTILQFARLADQVEQVTGTDSRELGRRLIVEAKLARSSLQPVPGELDDLPDPMGRGRADFEICADRIEDAIARILRPLAVQQPGPGPV